MQPSIRLGRLFGVEIGLHYSWFVIALLIALSLAGHFRMHNPAWPVPVAWAAALVAALSFFAAILLHELSHAAVARHRGVPVRSITLFALGGVAHMEKDAGDAKSEFWIGIVGPLTSFALGLLAFGLAWLLGWTPGTPPQRPVPAVLMWLGHMNLVLGAFNLVPGFPLDGGRVLRAVVWWRTKDKRRATRTAAQVGQGVAFSLILLGLWRFFGGAGFGGLWLAFIGWFLLDAARASVAEAGVAEALGVLRVVDVMNGECPSVEARMSLRTLADEHILRTGRRCFFVQEDGRPIGLITLQEMKRFEPERWPATAVSEAMRPLESLRTVVPETVLLDAFETMVREDVNQLPVVRAGRLEGVVSRAHVLAVLEARAELPTGEGERLGTRSA